jgi:hypothetical protein
MRPFSRAIPSAFMALVNLGLQVSGYTNFGLACVLWAIAAILAFWGVLPWLAGLRLKPVSATSERPPQRAGHADATPSQGTHAPKVEPDIWLSNAMWRAFLRTDYIPEGGVSNLKITEPEKQRFVMFIIGEFRQRSFDGEIPVWGRKDSSNLEPVPREFWRRNQIDPIQVARVDPPEEVKACAERPWEKPDTSGDWHHFKTSKAVIERLYPTEAK